MFKNPPQLKCGGFLIDTYRVSLEEVSDGRLYVRNAHSTLFQVLHVLNVLNVLHVLQELKILKYFLGMKRNLKKGRSRISFFNESIKNQEAIRAGDVQDPRTVFLPRIIR